MTDHQRTLALVVHGIGEQERGETLDALVGNLTGDLAAEVESECRWFRAPDRDHEGPEPERDVAQFPCETRHVRYPGGETVFAEVYWGDLSRAAVGRFAGIVALFQLVTGLGHIVRENAAEMEGQNRRTRAARFFVMLLQGPIMVLNIVLGLGVVVVAALSFLAEGAAPWALAWVPTVSMLVLAGILMLLGRVLCGPKKSELFLMFCDWLGWIGWGLVGIVAVSHAILPFLPQDWLESLFAFVRIAECTPQAGWTIGGCFGAWYTDLLIIAIGLCWIAAILIVAWLILMHLIFGPRGEKWRRTLYPATCAAMLILWMFIAMVVWVSGAQTLARMAKNIGIAADFSLLDQNLHDGISLSSGSWLAFLALLAGIIVVWRRRVKWVRENTVASAADTPVPRLIVNSILRVALGVGLIFLVFAAGFEVLRKFDVIWPEIAQMRLWPVLDWLLEKSLLAAMLVAIAYGFLHTQLAVGIGIVKDIVVWFVRRRGDEDPDRLELVTLQADGEAHPAPPVPRGGMTYPEQRRILDRFQITYAQMVAAYPDHDVVVIAHSQGTLVAWQALTGKGLPSVRSAGAPKPKLVTMGSPITHIYGTYFPSRHRVSDDDRAVIGDWLNIYRIDDFVGTTVVGETPEWPRNEPVHSCGHTGYWTDDHVRPHLMPLVLPGLA